MQNPDFPEPEGPDIFRPWEDEDEEEI